MITARKKAEAAAMLAEGRSAKYVAKWTGISRTTARRIRRCLAQPDKMGDKPKKVAEPIGDVAERARRWRRRTRIAQLTRRHGWLTRLI